MTIYIRVIVVSLLTLTFISGFVVVLNNGIKNKPIEKKEKTINLSYPDLLVHNGNKLALLNIGSYNQPRIFDKLED